MNSQSTSEGFSSCKVCQKQLKGKKKLECNDCSQIFCKIHLRVNDNDFSALCSVCFKNRIHLEVSMTMEDQILKAKTELRVLKGKLKSSKTEVECIDETISSAQQKLESNNLRHREIVKDLTEQIERQSAANSIKIQQENEAKESLALRKAAHELTSHRFNSSAKENSQSTSIRDSLNRELPKLVADIQASSSRIKDYVSYSSMRTSLCGPCKSKIKSTFGDEIVKGNSARNSIVASVMSEKNRLSLRSSLRSSGSDRMKKQNPEHDSCGCVMF